MSGEFLVTTPISSLYTSQATCIPIQTVRQNIALPRNPQEYDLPLEHAVFSSVLNTPTTGTILLRVIHGGLIIELISLSTNLLPIRFVFPAMVLHSPAVFLWETSELHILAVTDFGSLYRVAIPVRGRALWQDQIESIWPREYIIRNFPENPSNAFVHVHGPHMVAIAMSGSLLRLEADFGYDGRDEEWVESVFNHSSFLTSLTSLIPTFHAAAAGGADIISMATNPWPTDIGHVWTLSRDRTLRFWKAKIGCVSSKNLPHTSSAMESSPSEKSSIHSHLLETEPQALLRVFSDNTFIDHLYVLVFIPTISSSTSGGSFRLIDTYEDQLHEIGVIECSKSTAFCHLQDFKIVGNHLYALWDRQGQSSIESTVIRNLDNISLEPCIWRTTSYTQQTSELTPAYMEEQLLTPGSLVEKYFEAVMRPGMFSALTLRIAIDQYTDSCFSLPGPPAPQLSTTYATLAENIAAIVGCTVTLNRDIQTGALQYANYWIALKRDWEGFVARCREIERSSRWPLVLGVEGQDEIIVVERERVGSAVKEDLPITICDMIEKNHPLDTQYELFNILWTLRSKLGPEVMSNLEIRVTDILHQEIAFSFADILHDQTQRIQFSELLDKGSSSWFAGRLQSIGNLDAAIRTAIDVIGGLGMEVKREEDEVELLLPSSHSEWSVAQAASFTITTIEARYSLCLSLVTLLFFLSDELRTWDPSLLAEVFAVFRGVAMLRLVAVQPVGGELTSSSELSSPDDVLSRLRNMNVSHSKSPISPKVSLMQRLLAQSGDAYTLPTAAHRFLDSTGLLESISPARATKFEVLFCERLRLLGYYNVTRELLSWLPRTPGVTYILALTWLNLGRPDDASQLLEKLAGNFGPENGLTVEDQQALSLVLPATQLFDSEFSFYVWAANTFKNSLLIRYEVSFSQLALSIAPPEVDTSTLWHSVINGYSELGMYDLAHASLMVTPYNKQQKECATQLAIRMCEENAVEKLLTLDFGELIDEVVAVLSFKARNVDPRIPPFWSKILYSWFVNMGDYRNASLTMYQRAKKLREITTADSFFTLAIEQLDALSISINALYLVDPSKAWFIMPVVATAAREPRKLQRLSRHIPEARYTAGTYDAEIVHLADMESDCALLRAQIDIISREPTLLASPEFLLPAPLIVLRLAKANQFSLAMSTARSLKVDMTDIFSHLVHQCLRLSRHANAAIQETTSDWLLTDNVSTWQGTPTERGWRYLRKSLECHDGAETDYKYSKAAMEIILSVDKYSSPPPWLVNILQKYHPEYLIRLSLRYENLEDAVNYTLDLIRKSDSALSKESKLNASAAWLPYTLIDQVLVTAASQDKPPSHLAELRSEITVRMQRMQKLSHAG